jgi:hypothetical protein
MTTPAAMNVPTKQPRIMRLPGMGMSLPWAEFVSSLANWTLFASLLIGVAATYWIVVSGNVKEAALKRDVAAANERAAAANERAELAKRENIELQGILMPRFFPTDAETGPLGEKFSALKAFAGMEAQTFVVPDFSAEKYALQIAAALQTAGWRVLPTKVDPAAFEGVSVYSGAWEATEEHPDRAFRAGQALIGVFNEISEIFGLGQQRIPMTLSPEAILPNVGRTRRPSGIVTVVVGMPETYVSLMRLRHFGPFRPAKQGGEPH